MEQLLLDSVSVYQNAEVHSKVKEINEDSQFKEYLSQSLYTLSEFMILNEEVI